MDLFGIGPTTSSMPVHRIGRYRKSIERYGGAFTKVTTVALPLPPHRATLTHRTAYRGGWQDYNTRRATKSRKHFHAGPLRCRPGSALRRLNCACIAADGTGNPKAAIGIFETVKGCKRRIGSMGSRRSSSAAGNCRGSISASSLTGSKWGSIRKSWICSRREDDALQD